MLGHELSFYDTQPPAYVGWDDQFIASARLDNLLSCHVALAAIAEAGSELSTLIVLNDHEEVGSGSAAGAQGPFLRAVLERMVPGSEALTRAIDRSLFVSADNAHGIHPNHAAKHDANHGPRLNQGPVIKFNASQPGLNVDESTTLPLPVLALGGDFYLTDRATITAGVRGLKVKIGDVDGSVIGATLASEYWLANNWGVGAALDYLKIEADVTKSGFRGNLEFKGTSGRLYLTARF